MTSVSFSIVIPAKGEKDCLPRTVGALRYFPVSVEVIVVGDRESLDSIKSFSYVTCIESPADMETAVNLGIQRAKNNIIVKIDSDIVINWYDLMYLVGFLFDYDLVSCSASTRAKSTLMNFLFIGRDVLQTVAPLGCSSNGNTLIFRKADLAQFGGFHYDTKLHFKYQGAGKRILVINKTYAKEYRACYSIAFVKGRQINSGIKRRQLGISFKRSLFHAIVRGRPFVVVGWLQEHWRKV